MNIEQMALEGMPVPIANYGSPAPKVVKPPQITYGTPVLAMDQSLSNTGWVMLWTYPDNHIAIRAHGMLTAKDNLKGNEKTLTRATEVYDEAVLLFQSMTKAFPRFQVIYESPPNVGGYVRTESTILAAHSIRLAAIHSGLDSSMASNQRASTRWVGKPNSSKAERKAALEAFGLRPDKPPWNQHIVDATLLGLTWMENYG